MKLLDVTEVQFQYEDLKHHKVKKPVKPTQQRSGGVHLSQILKYLHFGSLPPAPSSKEQQKVLDEAALELDDPSVMNLRMILGMAWESFVVGFYPDLVWQPKELLLDGVAGSMDGYTWAYYEDRPVIEEFKYTHKSCRARMGQEILKDTLWMWQIKGYCWMYWMTQSPEMGGGLPLAQMNVLYGNGDYERPFRERYLRYLIEFEEQELEEFWRRAILPNKEKAIKWAKEQEKLNAL